MSSTLSTCDTCVGHGLWAIGAPAPMYRMDAEDGMPTVPCPECGANANPLGFEPPTNAELKESNQKFLEELLERLEKLKSGEDRNDS